MVHKPVKVTFEEEGQKAIVNMTFEDDSMIVKVEFEPIISGKSKSYAANLAMKFMQYLSE